MARVVPSVLWVVVLVSTNSILALDCNTADIQVKEGQTELIGTGNLYGLVVSMAAYVKPESDFQGISVDAWTTQGNLYTAWFPAQECLTITHMWMQFSVGTMIKNKNSTHAIIGFHFKTPTCSKYCTRAITPQSLQGANVKIHGPSWWRKTQPPKGCDVTSLKNYTWNHEVLTACHDPPSYTTTTNTTTTTTIIIAVSTTAVVVVLVVVVVVVLCWKCKFVTSRRAGRATAVPQLPHHTIATPTHPGRARGVPHLPHHTRATHSQEEEEDHIYDDYIELIDCTNTILNGAAMTHHQGAMSARGATRFSPSHDDDDDDDVYEEPRQEPLYESIENVVPYHLEHDDVYEEPRQLALYENIENVVPYHLQHDDLYIRPRQEPLYNDVDNVVSTAT